MHAIYPLGLAALLFAVGVYGVLARRNAVTVLMAIELLLNAVNLNLVTFSSMLRDRYHIGEAFTLFIITIAAAETGLGLAIILMLYRHRHTASVEHHRALGEGVAADRVGPPAGPERADGAGTSATNSGGGSI